MEELITVRHESEKKGEDQSEAKREAVVNEKKQALEMRDRALERIVETRNRNEEERAEEKKTVGRKRTRSGGDMLEWLRERAESDLEIKKQEMKEERGKRSYGGYKARTTATAGANSSSFAATTALSATAAAAETTTAICLNATANDWYVSTTTTTNAGSAVFSKKKGI